MFCVRVQRLVQLLLKTVSPHTYSTISKSCVKAKYAEGQGAKRRSVYSLLYVVPITGIII